MNNEKLNVILREMFVAEYDLKISAYDVDENENVLFSGAPLYEYFIMKYGDYDYSYSGLFGAIESFRISFETFKTRNQNNLNRQYQALIAEYNPIENYSMTESGTDTKTGTDTETKSGSRDLTQNGTRTLANNDGQTTTGNLTDSASETETHNIFGFDSANAVPADSSIRANSTTTTFSNTQTETFTNYGTTETFTDYENETEYNTETAHEMTRAGNIGVTTSQQMIQSELEIRVHDIACEFLKKFADEYLHYIGVCVL